MKPLSFCFFLALLCNVQCCVRTCLPSLASCLHCASPHPRTRSTMSNLAVRKLFVDNLSFKTTNDDLESAFSRVGPVKLCFVATKKGQRQCLGFGYVLYALHQVCD